MLPWYLGLYNFIELSDNMFVNYIANTMTFPYWSTMGQNVRHIISKYKVTHHEILYMPMSAIESKCKELCFINVNATYYDCTNMICKMVIMKNRNIVAIIVTMISYLSTL